MAINNFLDRNNDGKLDQEDVSIILGDIYKAVLDGIPGVSKTVEEFSTEYLAQQGDVVHAAKSMIDSQIVKCTTSGFLTSLGGLITLPVAIPANISSVIYVQMRMIASLAFMGGFDVRSDVVQTLIYACLAGVGVGEAVKKAGIQAGNKAAINLIKKIPGATLTKINQKVGFRFITKFGEKGIINIAKLVPLVGGVVGGGIDLVETKAIAHRAYKQFIEKDFSIDDDGMEE